ncbi:MAG: peptidoglycan editing factor PgeF [Clostridium butyricum]|nr:peptidoglycan editing factor PgeF [Clostridium butyricum]
MNKLKLSEITKEKDFLKIDKENYKVIFTNAELGRSFNRNTEEGVSQLNSLKGEFNADEIIYLKQVHSDKILKYSKDDLISIKDNEGDAIITNEKNVIIGVFTADCVPVILVDKVKKVSGAIHSGWKGTFASITYKTIKRMESEFNCSPSDIEVYIGPHIRKCCYEVSKELKEKFINEKRDILKSVLFSERNLNLECCILNDLKKAGVNSENVNVLDLCTYCSDTVKLHSYRKSNGSYGRMFSFIILN